MGFYCCSERYRFRRERPSETGGEQENREARRRKIAGNAKSVCHSGITVDTAVL
jgi:hypothetical protein